jgi:hypothetical protein
MSIKSAETAQHRQNKAASSKIYAARQRIYFLAKPNYEI